MFKVETIESWGDAAQVLRQLEREVLILSEMDSKQTPIVPSKVSAERQFDSCLETARALYIGKFREFFEAAATCIEVQHYVVLAHCLRGVLEHAGTLHHFLQDPEISECMRRVRLGSRESSDYDAAISALDRFTRGNMFAWDALIDGEGDELQARASAGTQRQVRVAKAALPALYAAFPESKVAYNMLSDMVHPNIGGHLLLFRESAHGAVVGGRGSKAPALSLAQRPLILTLATYMKVCVPDLERLVHLRIASDPKSKSH